MARLHNLTPHEVVLQTTDGRFVAIPSIGSIRLGEIAVPDGEIENERGDVVARVQVRYLPSELPPPLDDTTLIVSALVAQAFPKRRDLVFPAAVRRGADGQVQYAAALARTSDCRDES